MKINVSLSSESIQSAIEELSFIGDQLDQGMKDVVDILTTEGAEKAQAAYGSMATVSTGIGDYEGVIVASGDAVVIAEFGAGDATMPIMFENYVGVDVYPGAYSEQVGSGEYAATGKWHFGGNEYTEVEPRAGLLNAKLHIKDVAEQVVREVIQLD